MVKPKTKKIDITKLFEEKSTDFLESLNEKIKDGMLAENMIVDKFDTIETKFGESLRVELTDTDDLAKYSFLCSGKVFNELFRDNVKPGDKLKIYQNEKTHWRFEFVE